MSEHNISREQWDNDLVGYPDDYSPGERSYDKLRDFHKNDNFLSNCCGYPINSYGRCSRCHNKAEPMTLEMEENDAF